MPRVLLALGSNLGDRGAILDAAVAAICELSKTQVLARSTWHATKPVGGPAGQEDFLNGAVLIETELAPIELHHALQQIEQRLGRERTERWAARTLDIDMLLYDNQVIDEPDLQVPHPRMSFRPFVLAPVAEVAAEMVHPVLGVSIGALWHHLQHADDKLAICGGLCDDRRRLMENLLCRFPPNTFAALSKFPALHLQMFPALTIRAKTLAPDPIPDNQFRAAMKMGQPVTAIPKLQIYFEVPADEFSQYLSIRGSLHDQQLWQRLQKQPDIPNAMSCLFTGIPTLTLDPRDDPTHQLTEAAAALEAVWLDLCRTGA